MKTIEMKDRFGEELQTILDGNNEADKLADIAKPMERRYPPNNQNRTVVCDKRVNDD